MTRSEKHKNDSRPRAQIGNAQKRSVLWLTSGVIRSATGIEQARMLRDLLAERYQVNEPACSSRSSQKRQSPMAALKRLARRLPQADIVHLHLAEPGAWDWPTVAKAVLVRFFGRPLLVDLRDCLHGFDIEHPPLKLHLILNQSKLAVVATEFAAGRLKRQGYPALAIPEALSDNDFPERQITSLQPSLLSTVPDGDRAAAVSLARAFRLVKDKYPRTAMTVIGRSQDGESFLRLLDGWTAGLVSYVDADNTAEVRCSFTEADLYLTPAVEIDRCSVLKAMAAGVPVIAATESGLPDLVIDRYNGLTYRWNDPGALSDAVIELTENRSLLPELIAHGLSTAAAHRWSTVSRLWLDCYRQLRPKAVATKTTERSPYSPELTWRIHKSPR